MLIGKNSENKNSFVPNTVAFLLFVTALVDMHKSRNPLWKLKPLVFYLLY